MLVLRDVFSFHFGAEVSVDARGNEFLLPSHLLEADSYRAPLYGKPSCVKSMFYSVSRSGSS